MKDENIYLNIGDTFRSKTDGTEFKLLSIQEFEIVNGKKKKLDQKLYKFEFLNDNRPPFTTRHEDVRRAHIFKSWIKI